MKTSKISKAKKEPVKLREKVLANGNISLYLDIYRNGKRRDAQEPTILNNVFSALNLYFMTGGILALLISAFVKREANPFAEDKQSENDE